MKCTVVSDKKRIDLIILMFAAFYFVSYLTRNNYATVIAEIISAEGISKGEASLALTGLSVFYGAGQLVSGFFGDRIQPKYLRFWGLSLASAKNILMPLCTSHYLMTLVWCINGFAQAFMWPPIVKICSVIFDSATYSVACRRISYGSAIGTMFLYLFSPLVIKAAGWRMLFFGAAVCGIIAAFVCLKGCVRIELRRCEKEEGKASLIPRIVIPITAAIMLAIILQGILRDGVTTWMPSYLSETFGIGTELSILSGNALPIFSMICYSAAQKLYSKFLKNELICAAVIFASCAIFSVCLASFGIKTPVISVVLSALIVGTMHGVNLILICMVPRSYKNTATFPLFRGFSIHVRI